MLSRFIAMNVQEIDQLGDTEEKVDKIKKLVSYKKQYECIKLE